jgi:fatty-acyl-CoA synthase
MTMRRSSPAAAVPAGLTLVARIEASAAGSGRITFVAGDDETGASWTELHDDARGMAAALQARGVAPGDHVAVLGPTTRRLVTAMQATWLTGATLVVLPLPMRLSSIEQFVVQTRARILRADISVVLADADLAPFIEPVPGDPPMVLLDDLSIEAGLLGGERFERPADDPDAIAVLQFTSGSTAEPKGVVLSNRAICANLDAIEQAALLDRDDDVMVSWLPLYHDMGLIGFWTLPVTTGTDLVLGAPQDFLARPARWMEWLSRHGGTATAGPNFSWVLATRALRRAEGLDLSRLRIALNGAEPVDPRSVEAFVDAAAPHGLRPGAVFPAFGMAEVAIAGTFPVPMTGLEVDSVDLRVLETEGYAAPVAPDTPGQRSFVMLGRPVPGLEIRVVDRDDGRPLADREAGELEIRGTSVTAGYYRNPEATRSLFHDGWLRTGDLAYLVDGQLVICGRIKDVIIIGGRNVFPEDIERGVAEVEGVRPGNVIAFGVEGAKGRETLVVVAEVRSDDHQTVRKEVHHRVMEISGVPPHEVLLVVPGTLPKTSSGKLQRGACRDRYHADELQPA